MKKITLGLAALIALNSPAFAQDEKPETRSSSEAVAQAKARSSSGAVAQTKTHPSPNAILDAAPDGEWVAIPAEDLLVMTLAPAADGTPREVVIQLMPAPFSQGWVSNIRTLARAKWYDGITVNRVQDNYVVQWGDANGEDEAKAKPLPEGLKVMDEGDYVSNFEEIHKAIPKTKKLSGNATTGEEEMQLTERLRIDRISSSSSKTETAPWGWFERDSYAGFVDHIFGWPIATYDHVELEEATFAPVHCYGMVGVGRGYSPDTGSGAELYTVIGHAPRHLDRNIALVGRIISGIEHLSSMTRGTGPLGFYTEEEAELRTPIQSIRVVSDLDDSDQPKYQYLSTESESFAKYAEARANRRDPFFIKPAGGADICNIPVPIRASLKNE
ncbi:MAG: peptidylprolyl isomerase [Erythrobacter sp.]